MEKATKTVILTVAERELAISAVSWLVFLILDELVMIAGTNPPPIEVSAYLECARESCDAFLRHWPYLLAGGALFLVLFVKSAESSGKARWFLTWAFLLLVTSIRDDLWSFIWETDGTIAAGIRRLASDMAVAAGVTAALAFIAWGRHSLERRPSQMGVTSIRCFLSGQTAEGKGLRGWRLALAVFTAHVLIAACVILPFYIADGGSMMIAADWDAEQIPYSVLMNRAVKSGEVLWNWKIDIGSEFVSSFSFYNLASPFVWFSFLFPAAWIPHFLGLFLILKMAVAGLTSFWWLKRETGKRAAFIGSILYAFSGYQACNLVFNHFADAVALFPFLMIGLDELVQEKKRGRFLAAVALNAFTNWYFFIGEVIFLVLYYVVRYVICRSPQEMATATTSAVHAVGKELRDCLTEGILGVGITGVVLLPSLLSVMSNPRTGEKLPLADAFHFDLSNYMLILRGLFLPSEAMYELSFQKGGDWHLGPGYLPLFGSVLVIAYLLHREQEKAGRGRDWLKGMLIVGIVCMAIPLFNNLFSLESAEPYRRYMYMFILLGALASARVLERAEQYPWKCSIGISLLAIAVICVYSAWLFRTQGITDKQHVGESALLVLIGLFGIVAAWRLLANSPHRSHPQACFRTILLTSAFAVCGTAVTTELYRLNYSMATAWSTRAVRSEIEAMADNLDDAMPYRYSFPNNYYNYSMMHNVAGATSFISTVSPSIFEFYEAIGNPRHTWTPELDYATEAVLANRYLVRGETVDAASVVVQSPEEKGLQLVRKYRSGPYTMGMYENPYWVPFSSTYDSYITRSELEHIDPADRPAVMLGNLVVKDKDEPLVSGLLKHTDLTDLRRQLEDREKTDNHVDSAETDNTEGKVTPLGTGRLLNQYVEERRSAGMDDSSFRYSTSGYEFTLNADADADTWAFISVPYDSQWIAEVNGEPSDVLDICGLTAVRVQSGENHIVFHYTARNLKAGAVVTVVSVILSILYWKIARKRNG